MKKEGASEQRFGKSGPRGRDSIAMGGGRSAALARRVSHGVNSLALEWAYRAATGRAPSHRFAFHS
jgi:hypothetical protein